jgi:hypothetical protein
VARGGLRMPAMRPGRVLIVHDHTRTPA